MSQIWGTPSSVQLAGASKKRAFHAMQVAACLTGRPGRPNPAGAEPHSPLDVPVYIVASLTPARWRQSARMWRPRCSTCRSTWRRHAGSWTNWKHSAAVHTGICWIAAAGMCCRLGMEMTRMTRADRRAKQRALSVKCRAPAVLRAGMPCCCCGNFSRVDTLLGGRAEKACPWHLQTKAVLCYAVLRYAVLELPPGEVEYA